MKVRAELIHQIVEHVKRRNMTHQEAAELCQVTRPRMTDLLNGKISKFSLDALVKIVANAGFSIHVRLEERVHEEEFA
ncbi:XRE family transcriptional regulator [Acidovorax sp. A1169]|nr:XRE family transcriptional regulator [Acidovorax sp. A1169]MDP4078831.1 XRE family transcriptional regulator [Acidovorax sp. A1169]